jgi:hypothetical protein
MKTICTLLAAGAVALLATAPAAPMSPARLAGTVGPGFTITLKQNGKVAKTMKAGRYTFVVSDRSGIHNFAIRGPGLNRAITSVPFTGAKTMTLTLRRGTYTFSGPPHPRGLRGTYPDT